MKKRSCRRTGFEQEQHDRAIRVRKMTDAQLCAYLDELEAHNQPIVISQDELEKVINGFIDSLATRSGTGLRVSKPSISQEMVDNFILETWTQTAGEKTTIVRAMLRNGFELVEASSCVSPENYDEKLGREICMKKIKDRVWMLLGFLLQTAVNGVK